MLKNYFITAVRSLYRNLVYSLVNIFGLVLGIAVTLIVFLFIQFETSYDKYHKDYKQIYRVYRTATHPEFGIRNDARIGGAFHNIAKQNFPGVESSTRIMGGGDIYIHHNNEDFKESKFIFADSSIFSVFTFPFLRGDARTALKEPNSIIITEAIAKKYFGNEDPMGKTLGDKNPMKVTGILKDIPDRSHFRFNMLRSISKDRIAELGLDKWTGEIYTYIKLKKGYDPEIFRNSIGNEFVKKYVDVGDYKDYKLNIEPLEKIHLHGICEFFIGGDIGLTGDTIRGLLYLFGFLALSILVIACVNFTNIIISRSMTRSREVAMRKVSGATRFQLVQQFIGEYIIIAFIALNLALLIIELILPLFSSVIGRKISVDYFNNYAYLFFMFIILFAVGVLSGLYPSAILSSFSPIKVLNNSLKINKGGLFRRILIIFQFIFSILLIMISIFCYQQASRWTGKEMGYHKENLVVIQFQKNSQKDKFEILKNEFLKSPDITGVTAASINLSLYEPTKYFMSLDDKKEQLIDFISVDQDFIKTLGIEVREGRDFMEENSNDVKHAFIIDENAVRLWNLKDPVNKQIELSTRENGELKPYLEGTIIGVIKNFNYLPGYKTKEQKGLILNADKESISNMFVRVYSNSLKQASKYIKESYNRLLPGELLLMNTLDDNISNNFVIKILKKIIFFLTIIPILATIIALMGIFALVLQSSERRTHELAIRKIFGTPVFKLILLQIREYSFLILIANVISLSISYLLLNVMMHQNSGFEAPGAGIYIIVCLSTYFMGMLIVSSVVLKSVRKNPIVSLRYQ
jgi:putative ABC transport system permease protein